MVAGTLRPVSVRSPPVGVTCRPIGARGSAATLFLDPGGVLGKPLGHRVGGRLEYTPSPRVQSQERRQEPECSPAP